jgi:crossover junction endodeoxyribonuclease RusA
VIVIAYPNKALWPNGRAHWATKAREAKKQRAAAGWATKAANLTLGDGPYAVHIVCHPKARGPVPDRDNIIAAAKSAIDGIADALGVNDRHFSAPTVSIGDTRIGQFIITIS